MDINEFDDDKTSTGWSDRARNGLDKYRGMGIRGLFSNFASLSVLQAANYILPLIILPYLVRVIGVEKFGLVVFAQAIIQYFIIITDFGFNLSATREIATNREDISKLSTIFSSVLAIKSILLIVCFGILVILVTVFDKFSSDAEIYLFTYGLVIGNFLFPVWFFQGMEKMKFITALTVLGRVIYIVLLFVFVPQESDYMKVPLLNSIGMITTGLISVALAMKKFKVRLRIPAMSAMISQFRNSSQFFLSRVSVSLYSSFNTLILGFFTRLRY